jgi:hypothetical protein
MATVGRGALSEVANTAASQTNSTVVAAITNRRIRVIALAMVAGGTATTAVFNSGSTAAISPTFANAANGGAVLPLNDRGWFTTNAGEALTVTTGAGSATGILVTYVVV